MDFVQFARSSRSPPKAPTASPGRLVVRASPEHLTSFLTPNPVRTVLRTALVLRMISARKAAEFRHRLFTLKGEVNTMRVCICTAAVLVWGAVSSIAVGAQTEAQSSISGVVRDASGAILPGVTVEATSPALIEKVRTAVTGGTGQYRIVESAIRHLHSDLHADRVQHL